MWVYLWAFYPIPLIYISIFVPETYCLNASRIHLQMEMSTINLTEVVSQITQLRFHALKEKKDDLCMKKKPLFFLYLML